MVEAALLQYIRGRLEYGDSLSEIRLDLKKAGYSDAAINLAFDEVKSTAVVTEKVLALNPSVLKKENSLDNLTQAIKHYSKPIIAGVILLFLVFLTAMLSHVNWAGINWKETLVTGLIYLTAYVLTILIQSLMIYSLHKLSVERPSIRISFTHILFSGIAGHVFTIIAHFGIPSVSIWVPILVGGIIFMLALLAGLDSSVGETISSLIIFCTLAYFLYTLISRVYTQEVLLGFLGLR